MKNERPDQRHPQHQRPCHRDLESPWFEILQIPEHGKIFKKQHFTNTGAQSGHGEQYKNSTYYEMPEFVGFQTMGILVPYRITFDAVGVSGLALHLFFKSCST